MTGETPLQLAAEIGIEVHHEQTGDAVHQQRTIANGQHVKPEISGGEARNYFLDGAE